MLTLTDSLVSSSARKLRMKMRADLTAKQQRYQGRLYWVVKEPVGLNYFRFQEEEYAILKMLDGESSLDDLKDRFEEQFPPQKITVEEIQQFIGMLHRSQLIVVDAPGQGHQLVKRRAERTRKELIQKFTNILAIRFKGIDPDRLLTWMHPRFKWIYHPVAVFAWAVIAISALSLVLVQFDVFQSKLPAFHQFFSPSNAIWLGVALMATKVVHEFGHGLTCKHFGGECHEMGVMILVLTPCLYCNVSDSWMLPSKWRRAAIGFAGIYVEIFIASICTFIWWFSEPGMLNHLALSTMFVCSVSTILFNGNPLLRYDGYYILSDIIEIPNLRQKATDILNRKMGELCLGIEPPDDPFLPERNQALFALYSVAAAVYRWIVTFSILWFLYKVWEPYRLEVIGQIIGLLSLYTLLVQPLWKLGKFFYIPGRIEKVKKPRLYASLAVVSLIIAAIAFIPLPYRIICTFEVQPRDAEYVVIDVPGRVQEIFVKPGDQVTAGQKLAQLDNIDVEIEIQKYKSDVEQYEAQLKNLRRATIDDDTALLQIDATEKALETTKQSLKEKQRDLEHLTLVSSISGTVMSAQGVPKRPDPYGQLPTWSGTPFDGKNKGAVLPENVTFCIIGDPEKLEAVMVVDQSKTPYIRLDQKVAIKLAELPHDTLYSKISEISTSELKEAPRALSSKYNGELPTVTDETGVERPQSPTYQIRAPLDDPERLMRIGLTGRAKIYAQPRTLGDRLWTYVTETFNFRL